MPYRKILVASDESPTAHSAVERAVDVARHTGAGRFLLDSVPNKISHHAPCALFIVRTT